MAPPLADKLYGILIRNAPVTDDMKELLEQPRNGNGGNGDTLGQGAVGF
jgi:hypothetical protein